MAAVMRGLACRGGRGMVWLLLLAVLSIVDCSSSVEVYTPDEVTVENGTQAKLSCTFKSSSAIQSDTFIIWRYKEDGQALPVNIFGFIRGKPVPWGERFKDRTTWAGDLNKKDASIKIERVTFKDNGTYICEVMTSQDLGGVPKELKLRVVEKGNLPVSNVPFLVGIICAAIGGLLLIAIIVFAVVITKKKRSRKNYAGCSTTESLMSPVKQPPCKSPSDTEALVTHAPTGTMQGPVIYAQLDHSGKASSQVNKSERVVYADIRKVC